MRLPPLPDDVAWFSSFPERKLLPPIGGKWQSPFPSEPPPLMLTPDLPSGEVRDSLLSPCRYPSTAARLAPPSSEVLRPLLLPGVVAGAAKVLSPSAPSTLGGESVPFQTQTLPPLPPDVAWFSSFPEQKTLPPIQAGKTDPLPTRQSPPKLSPDLPSPEVRESLPSPFRLSSSASSPALSVDRTYPLPSIQSSPTLSPDLLSLPFSSRDPPSASSPPLSSTSSTLSEDDAAHGSSPTLPDSSVDSFYFQSSIPSDGEPSSSASTDTGEFPVDPVPSVTPKPRIQRPTAALRRKLPDAPASAQDPSLTSLLRTHSIRGKCFSPPQMANNGDSSPDQMMTRPPSPVPPASPVLLPKMPHPPSKPAPTQRRRPRVVTELRPLHEPQPSEDKHRILQGINKHLVLENQRLRGNLLIEFIFCLTPSDFFLLQNYVRLNAKKKSLSRGMKSRN